MKLHQFVFVTNTAFWLVFITFVMIVALPYNPLSIRPSEERLVRSFVPEGWGFFTRNPREKDLQLYFKRDGYWVKNKSWPISSISNLGGMDRYPRAQSVELAMILKMVPDSSWRYCQQSFIQCLNGIKPLIIKNPSPNPTLKGSICITSQSPVPWAWYELRENYVQPSYFIVVDLK
jgi:antimicrobial peptide system SdpA family protein